jgi:hypothetical protein
MPEWRRSPAAERPRSPVSIPLLLSPPTVGNSILVAGNHASGWPGNLHEACIEAYVHDLPYYSLNRMASWFTDSRRGDHYNDWLAGVPAVALVGGLEYRNPHDHEPGDTPDTLDATLLRQNAQAALATMLEWAGVPERGDTWPAHARVARAPESPLPVAAERPAWPRAGEYCESRS